MVLNIFQSRFKIWPNTKLTLENCQRLLTFHHSGEILVTLPRVENFYIKLQIRQSPSIAQSSGYLNI